MASVSAVIVPVRDELPADVINIGIDVIDSKIALPDFVLISTVYPDVSKSRGTLGFFIPSKSICKKSFSIVALPPVVKVIVLDVASLATLNVTTPAPGPFISELLGLWLSLITLPTPNPEGNVRSILLPIGNDCVSGISTKYLVVNPVIEFIGITATGIIPILPISIPPPVGPIIPPPPGPIIIPTSALSFIGPPAAFLPKSFALSGLSLSAITLPEISVTFLAQILYPPPIFPPNVCCKKSKNLRPSMFTVLEPASYLIKILCSVTAPKLAWS